MAMVTVHPRVEGPGKTTLLWETIHEDVLVKDWEEVKMELRQLNHE